MDADRAGLAGLTPPGRARPNHDLPNHDRPNHDRPNHDRFSGWSRIEARIALALLAVLILLSALAPGYPSPPPPPPLVSVTDHAGHTQVVHQDDNDLLLYRHVIARVRHGDDYYRAAVEEQRRSGYPVSPGLTVRLPTLALLAAAIGDRGMLVLAALLFGAMILAMHRRLGQEPGAAARMPLALALLTAGIASGLHPQYNVLHEVWAAQLMALSLALHRPARAGGQGNWGWSWLAAALALAVRELVLPYVLLMAACAAWQRRWREAAAWTVLVGLFAAALAVHLRLAAAPVVPGDPASPSWIVLKGLAGLLYKVNNSTLLNLLPLWVSGPCVILALFGWAGWRSPLGATGFLLTGGYAVAFMIAGRDNNFYWGLIITPLLFRGGAFLPVSLPGLWRRAAWTGPRRQSIAA